MKGHVIISHGLESSPDARKASALARVAEQLGWTHERPDYRDLDAVGILGDVQSRIERLKQKAQGAQRPLVLAGSSMGAFISAQVSEQVICDGLFLMAPPVAVETYPKALSCAEIALEIVHPWNDELIPAMDVIRWAQRKQALITMVNDSHRLEANVDFCAELFRRFLLRLR
jgi:alpha/beta superfamily hydrolase